MGNRVIYGGNQVLLVHEQTFLHRFVEKIASSHSTFQGIYLGKINSSSSFMAKNLCALYQLKEEDGRTGDKNLFFL